eukprot:TRINITY_DN5340_c0_g1_i3.p1 TRINITY_DN5340_c0_g1~~TRINITY_DN5340_c0_g1_i3.p1  ORF type:complete len:268 (-),score=40.18 TRINITY_DN5340_c0_g1_i3:153-956(-)
MCIRDRLQIIKGKKPTMNNDIQQQQQQQQQTGLQITESRIQSRVENSKLGRNEIYGFKIRSWESQFFNFQYYRFPKDFSFISNMCTNFKFFFANYIIITFIGVILGAFRDTKMILCIGGCCLAWSLLLKIPVLTDSNLKRLIWLVIIVIFLYMYIGQDIISVIFSGLLIVGFHSLFLELPEELRKDAQDINVPALGNMIDFQQLKQDANRLVGEVQTGVQGLKNGYNQLVEEPQSHQQPNQLNNSQQLQQAQVGGYNQGQNNNNLHG